MTVSGKSWVAWDRNSGWIAIETFQGETMNSETVHATTKKTIDNDAEKLDKILEASHVDEPLKTHTNNRNITQYLGSISIVAWNCRSLWAYEKTDKIKLVWYAYCTY